MSAEAQIASIPHTQEAPVRTHSMVCGWYNTSLKTWYYGVNPNLEHLRALSSSALALCALIRKSAYFLHLQHSLFDQSKGGLCLWAPVPPNEEELQTAFEASEIAARWLGIETLTTKTIEGYVSTLERVGFKVKSKTEPYLAKKISNQGFNPTLFRKEAMPSETMEGF